MNNIYDNPENKELIASLKGQLKELRAKYKEDDPKFKFNKVINEFWDYDEEDYKKAIEISHRSAKIDLAPKKEKKKKKPVTDTR